MKRVLFYTQDAASFTRFLVQLGRLDDVQVGPAEHGHLVQHADGEAEFVPVHEPEDARRWLAEHYVHLVIVDLRASRAVDLAGRLRDGMQLLELLDHPEDIEARYGFHRILVLLDDTRDAQIDDFLLRLGGFGVNHVLRQRRSRSDGAAAGFAREVCDTALQMITRRSVGKTALAASGGGITGIYYELGALKCLDDVLSGGVNQFDMYFGISAGAVVTSVIAAGYSVDEFMAALVGTSGGRIPPLNLSLVRLGHLNVADMQRRLGAAARTGVDAARRAWRREPDALSSLFLDYTALVGPPFRSDQFEKVLRRLFEARGATNDFRELPRPLFIGASDQDARRPVLFGAEGLDDVPISRAVQASLSIHPAFSAVPINGRWYEDGAVTRTSDFVEAIEHGADLIFVLDPFVPYVSREPGATNRQGILYNIDQEIRALSFTRYENTRNWVLRKHPEVSSYTFVPSNRLRRLLSVNPMDHRPYLEIWRGAYLSTFYRLKSLCHRLRGDLIAHGITVDTARAEEIARRLKQTKIPAFADFFVDRKVEIRQPPLAREALVSAG